MLGQKFLIAGISGMPALILDKRIVRTQVHGHRLAADGAVRYKFGRDAHIFLFAQHCPYHALIVVSCMVAGDGALKQTVVSLRIKQSLLVKARDLKAMVDVCR